MSRPLYETLFLSLAFLAGILVAERFLVDRQTPPRVIPAAPRPSVAPAKPIILTPSQDDELAASQL